MRYERKRDTVVAYLEGDLDHCRAQSVRRDLDEILTDVRVKRLVLDMRLLGFMDSSGIGVILGRYRTLSQRGGSVAVTKMNPHVSKIFTLSGMGQIIDIV